MSAKHQNKNARKHGAYAQILPPTNNDRKFKKMHSKLVKHYRPKGPLQNSIVRDLAIAMLEKRRFDRFYARELNNVFTEVKAIDSIQIDFQDQVDLDREIAVVERTFNEKNLKLAKQAVVAKRKQITRVQNEIEQLDLARKGALAPIHASRDRERKENGESSPLTKIERLHKAHAAVDARIDRCLRRLVTAKTYDELHCTKLIDHQPSTAHIDGTKASAKIGAREEDDDDIEEEADKPGGSSSHEERTGAKGRRDDQDDGDDWFPAKKQKKSDELADW